MKLWLIKQNANTGYDTFDLAVVVAADEEAAKCIHPRGEQTYWEDAWDSCWATHLSQVTAEYLGETELPAGRVVCASFNAG